MHIVAAAALDLAADGSIIVQGAAATAAVSAVHGAIRGTAGAGAACLPQQGEAAASSAPHHAHDMHMTDQVSAHTPTIQLQSIITSHILVVITGARHMQTEQWRSAQPQNAHCGGSCTYTHKQGRWLVPHAETLKCCRRAAKAAPAAGNSKR
jgi:hypothetical protein